MKAIVLFTKAEDFRLIQVENQGVKEVKYESYIGKDLLGVEAWKTLVDIPNVLSVVHAIAKANIKRTPKVIWNDGEIRVVLKEDYSMVSEVQGTNAMHDTFWTKNYEAYRGIGEDLAYNLLVCLLAQFAPKDAE